MTACLLAIASAANAQQWVDLTSEFVQNPSFEGNVNGWTVNYNGNTANNYGYQGSYYSDNDYTVYIYQFAEAWRNQSSWNRALGNGSIYQEIRNLPKGRFRLEANAIAVDQKYGSNPVTGAYLFIEDAENSAATEMATANEKPQHFTVEMESETTTLTIGIRTENTTANWIAFDEVQLLWYGTEVEATSIVLNEENVEMVPGETFQLTATVYPEDATFQRVVFYSMNPDVATVDEGGHLQAVSPGTAVIYAQMGVGNSNASATCNVTVKHNDVQPGDLVVNEVQQANIDMFIDPSWNYGGWIELYNKSNKTLSLSDLYISDDPNNLKKMPLDARFGAVPAGGFKTVWFDHYSMWAPSMVNFKLDADGGTLYLSNADGLLIIQQDFPPAIARTSYARTTDGGSQWKYTDQPTPDASNASSTFASIRLAAPVIDANGGFFINAFKATVAIPEGTTLRYTTDGSTPTLQNGQTSQNGKFDISATTILRLRLFKDGMLSSPVVTRSFIYRDRNYTLPVISLVSDNANLYGADRGIFVKGNGNGRPGNGQSSACNWNMDWDRPANIEYFNEDGQAAFNQEVYVEAAGGWSRAWEPHSFNIKANKVFEGLNRMDYQFFENKPFMRHKSLKVRNGGNDTGDRIKDPAIQEVVRTSGLYIETQSYKPVHIFHNGRYIGVENLREPNNRYYAFANYGIDSDEQDQWKMSPDSGYVQQAGTRDVFDEWYSLAQNASDALTYERIKELVDIEEYINYCAVELYIAGTDWPKNNIKSFRDNVNEGMNSRFRFVLFDTDGAFATSNSFTWFEGTNWWTFDQLYGDEVLMKYGSNIYAEIEYVTILLNMLKNEEFKKQFIDQFCIVTGSVFEPSRAQEVIDAMVAHVNPAMSLEGRSATSSANSVKNNLNASRQTSSVNNMRNYLNLGMPIKANLSADIDEARLFINDLSVPTGRFGGQLFRPITVRAAAPAGYRFAGWRSNVSTNSNNLFNQGTTWSYYDQGSLDGEDWKSAAYDASDWNEGQAPMGYDTGNAQKAAAYNTTLNYGGNSSNKYPTYYFRKQVNLTTAPKATDEFTLDWIADDGFVIYINGTEAGRFMMNNTPNPTFNSYADSYAPANPESGQMELDASLFHKGSNTIAIELHNNSANSTDIYWDAALMLTTESEGNIVSYDEEYTLPTSTTSITLVASYEALTDEELELTDSHPVKINEISAGNKVFVNEFFKKEDWIELYNTTDQDYDIAGMYLSDNLSKPEKFQIPASNGIYSTIIPAHGHLIIFADKQDCDTQLHANFKLENDDNCSVLLTAADFSWADTLTYCAHASTQSVGLYPNGSSQLYVMDRMTPAASNELTTTATFWDEPFIEPANPTGVEETEESTLQLIYADNALILNAPAAARVDVYSASGQLMLTQRVQPGTALSLSGLPAGIYAARATLGDEQAKLKFIKK